MAITSRKETKDKEPLATLYSVCFESLWATCPGHRRQPSKNYNQPSFVASCFPVLNVKYKIYMNTVYMQFFMSNHKKVHVYAPRAQLHDDDLCEVNKFFTPIGLNKFQLRCRKRSSDRQRHWGVTSIYKKIFILNSPGLVRTYCWSENFAMKLDQHFIYCEIWPIYICRKASVNKSVM